jgi:uncharacterized phage protein gp47/JayE
VADLPDRQELFRVFRRSIVTAPNPRINPAVVDIPGSDLNLIGGAVSLAGENVVSAYADCSAGNWSDTATDDKLDRLAYDRYGLLRKPANAATCLLTLTRPTPGLATPGTYAAGSRVQTPQGIVFSTSTDAVFGNFDTTVQVLATDIETGPDGNVSPGALNQFVDAPFDPTLTVTNAGAAGGTDPETDAQFRGRIRGFFPTLRRGVLGAIEFGARQVPGVAVATAIEVLNPTSGFPAAIVQLIVADSDGGSSPALLQAVRDELLTFRAAGIPVIVVGGVVVNELVTWRVAFETGVNSQLASAQIRAITVAVAQNLSPGQTLLRSSLIAGARAVQGAIVSAGSLVVPVGDIVPTDIHKLIRIRPQDIVFV